MPIMTAVSPTAKQTLPGQSMAERRRIPRSRSMK
jgi:hypothetical protein